VSRVHEWAWSDVGSRTVCGLTGRQLDRVEVVSDLGEREPGRRCLNCERMRASIGMSRRLPEASPIPVVPAPPGGLAPNERELLAHATGWDSRWPLFRNHFCAGKAHADRPLLEALVARGLMVQHAPNELSGGDDVFTVTAIGIAALKGTRRPPTGEAANERSDGR
jgi:hypothetical protein